MIATKHLEILLIEDNSADVETVRRTIDEMSLDANLVSVPDGRQAQEYVRKMSRASGTDRTPDLILLDLNLPGRDGLTLLSDIRRSWSGRDMPVVIFSGSDNRDDITASYRKGANAYVVKPPGKKESTRVIKGLLNFYRDIPSSRGDVEGTP